MRFRGERLVYMENMGFCSCLNNASYPDGLKDLERGQTMISRDKQGCTGWLVPMHHTTFHTLGRVHIPALDLSYSMTTDDTNGL